MKATLLTFFLFSALAFAGDGQSKCTDDLFDFSSDRRLLENIKIASRGQTDPAIHLWFDAFDSYLNEGQRPENISFHATPAITKVIDRINDLDMSFQSKFMTDDQRAHVRYLTHLFEKERDTLTTRERVNYFNLYRTAQLYALLNSGNQLAALAEAFDTPYKIPAGMWRMSLRSRAAEFRKSQQSPVQLLGEFKSAPWIFMVPTVEKLDFQDFTPLYPYPIYRTALAKEVEWGDGIPLSSHENLKHDIAHARGMFQRRRDLGVEEEETAAMFKELYRVKAGLVLERKFHRKRKSLSPRKQKLVDMMWLHLFHERYVQYNVDELRKHQGVIPQDEEVLYIKTRINDENDYALGFEKVPTDKEIEWAVDWVHRNF